MAESQTVVILRNKRDDIALAITTYERELERARADFAHITAALAIFDAGDQPGSQRPYTHLVRGFRYGELAALCRAAIAERAVTSFHRHQSAKASCAPQRTGHERAGCPHEILKSSTRSPFKESGLG
jgi:hypothetical protein